MPIVRIGAEEIRDRFDVLKAIDSVSDRIVDAVSTEVSGYYQTPAMAFLDDLMCHLRRTTRVDLERRYSPLLHVLDEGGYLLRATKWPSDVAMNRRITVDQRARQENSGRDRGMLHRVTLYEPRGSYGVAGVPDRRDALGQVIRQEFVASNLGPVEHRDHVGMCVNQSRDNVPTTGLNHVCLRRNADLSGRADRKDPLVANQNCLVGN